MLGVWGDCKEDVWGAVLIGVGYPHGSCWSRRSGMVLVMVVVGRDEVMIGVIRDGMVEIGRRT